MTSERWLRGVIAGACIVAAVVALAAALADDTPELTSDDARDFTEDALRDVGFTSVRLVGEPQRAEYQAQDKEQAAEPVWATRAQVRVGNRPRELRLAVHREEGVAVSLDEGRSRFFSNEQFEKLNQFSSSAAVDRQEQRDTAGVIAALLLIVVAAWLAVVNR